MINLRFVKGSGWSSKLITWFSGGHFSHVDAITPEKKLLGARSDEVGGRPAGVQIRPFPYESTLDEKTFSIGCTDAEEKLFWDFLYDQLGKPYDEIGIFGFVVGRDWRNESAWFCSELQAAALEYAGVLPRLYSPVNKITPSCLATVLSAVKAAAK